MAAHRVALLRAIDGLPPGYRLLLVLHDIHGYEHQEIAEIFGCTTGNTKSQLPKARLRLRAVINRPNSAMTSGRRDSRRSPVSTGKVIEMPREFNRAP